MATISTLMKGDVTHPTRNGDNHVPYVMEFDVDFAKVLTAKGSALAAADVINCLKLPAGAVVMGGGAQVLTPGNSTTCTINFGPAGGSTITSGLNVLAAANTYGADSSPIWTTAGTAASTLDVTLATLTGTLSTGLIRVWALILDVSKMGVYPNYALIGS